MYFKIYKFKYILISYMLIKCFRFWGKWHYIYLLNIYSFIFFYMDLIHSVEGHLKLFFSSLNTLFFFYTIIKYTLSDYYILGKVKFINSFYKIHRWVEPNYLIFKFMVKKKKNLWKNTNKVTRTHQKNNCMM